MQSSEVQLSMPEMARVYNSVLETLNNVEQEVKSVRNNPSKRPPSLEQVTQLSNLIPLLQNNLVYKAEGNEMAQRATRLIGEIIDLPPPLEANLQPIQRAPAHYHLLEEIDKVKNLAQKGLKLNLFVGRTSEDSLPLAASGEVWISLDYAYDNKGARSNEKFTNKTTRSSNNIHLVIDFNNRKELALIRNLFDKVVVDVGVLHWIDKISPHHWVVLATMLKNDSEAELITPTLPPQVWSFEEREKIIKNDCAMVSQFFDTGRCTIQGDYPYETKLHEKISFFIFKGPHQEKIKKLESES